jgi:hypothetical protein
MTESMMKKQTMDKRDLARLVDYYRMRVEGFDKERLEWLERLDGLRLTQEESHKMEWELRRRTDEILELQNCLSESNIAMNHERKQVINLTEELESAKVRTKEDRRRLVQLLQLAEPIEQTIKLYYDRRPEKLEKFSTVSTGGGYCGYDPDSISLGKSLMTSTGKHNIQISSNSNNNSISNSKKMKKNSSYNNITTTGNSQFHTQNNTFNNKAHLNISNCKGCTRVNSIQNMHSAGKNSSMNNKCNKCLNINNTINLYSPKLEYRIPPSDEKQQIVRTILLPNEDTDQTLKEENEFLRSQLNSMKNLYENQIFKLDEDRRLREEEIRLRDMNYKDKLEDLVRKNQKLDRLNYELTKDHMQLKYDSSNTEKRLYEELEMIKLQNEALSVSLKELMHRASLDKETTKTDYERKTREITNVMRTQVKTQEENNNIIKEQYKQIQKIYSTRVKELEEKLKYLTDKYKNLENKRNNEIEGYINEINMMRKRLKSYEEYIGKVRRYLANGDEVDSEEAKRVINDMENTKVNFYLKHL